MAFAGLSFVMGIYYSQPIFFPRKIDELYDWIILSGDILSVVLPVMGIIEYIICSENMERPQKSSAFPFVSTIGVIVGMHIIKRLFKYTPWDLRPNGHTRSFPSAHTASAFHGAILIQKS